ncbi:hypothetical protein [Endozoicomonas numazuensis]|uniref:Type II secretion system protein GspE N-terminal domain-containing protein n=1 Tax=Endozoicomonas numazuensis TaxID=1137799 RepID=A0A081NEL5_9GAMM|nr:hypothetical protein [Endozoicomonas numazuensis]KEQ16888.1 hypothetical protein GZ78_19740 [Endozoicomonas numazuensis]
MDNLKRAQAYHKSRLGQILVIRGYVTEEKIREAVHIQKNTDEKLGEILLQKKWVSRWQLRRALSNQTRMRFSASLAVVLLGSLESVSEASEAKEASIKDERVRLLSTLKSSLPEGESIHQFSYDAEKARADIRITGEVSLKVPCSAGELRIDHLLLKRSAAGDMETLELADIDLSNMKVSIRSVFRGKEGQADDSALGACRT